MPQESKRFHVWIPMFRVAWLKSARTGGHVRLEECRGRNRVYQWKIRTQRWVREADDIGKHALRTVWDPRALSGDGGQLNHPSTARRVRKKVSSGFNDFIETMSDVFGRSGVSVGLSIDGRTVAGNGPQRRASAAEFRPDS